jgi:hypothetical protein
MIEARIRSLLARRATTGLGLVCAMLACMACDRASSIPRAEAAAPDSAQGSVASDSDLRFPFVPDPAKTPGATLAVTAADVCVPGYAKRVRNVPSAVKRQAYAEYGVRTHEPGEYEVDHLISLKLGGSNSIRNLWPESFRTAPWNAYVKDALEDELYRRVCAGTMELATAQQVISHNWVIGYRAYVSPTPLPAGPHSRNGSHGRRRHAPRSQSHLEAPVP